MVFQAQQPVCSFPYEEGFSANFAVDTREFLPGWEWNDAEKDGQLFQFNWKGRTDMSSLALLPEGKAPVRAQLHLDLRGKKNTFMGFWVATLKNGGPKDHGKVFLSVSISPDGGSSFGFEVPIGPSEGFRNETTTFQYFQCPFPPVTNGREDLVIRFSVWSEGGTEQAAILLFDDVYIAQAPGDAAPPFIVSLE